MLLLLEMMKMKNRIATRLTLLLLALGLASPVLASDGVLEINETCAQVGCFNGDNPGWPVTISRAGSYRLTGNLNVPDENTTAILVQTDNVGIDLNGFAIIGPVLCSGYPSYGCTHVSGTGSGIVCLSPCTAIAGTSVRNGSISGMGRYGVFLGPQAQVSNLRVSNNRLRGIEVSSGSKVSGNTAYTNGSHGIDVESGSTVSGNTVKGNGGFGISGFSSLISGNAVSENGSHGVHVLWNGLVSGNTIDHNGGWAIIGQPPNNVSGYNGPVCRDNVITTNSWSIGTVSVVVDAGGNFCNGTPTCP